MFSPAFGSHDGAVAGADPHAGPQFERLHVQSAERLDETEAGFLIIGEDMPGHGAAGRGGEPNGLGLGDQIADRQDETVAADQDAATGTLGAERPGGKSILRNGCPHSEHRTQSAVQIKAAFAGLGLDLARDLPVYVSRHGGNPSVAPDPIITRKEWA